MNALPATGALFAPNQVSTETERCYPSQLRNFAQSMATEQGKTDPDEEIRRHISHAVAIESSLGWRLTKTKRGHKIDLAVVLGMAAWAAMQEQSQGLEILAVW